ncbi:MAG TPA: BrnT family toxin [bacterium]|nr:BrnT family toxin [bacterium]
MSSNHVFEWDFGKELKNILKHGVSFHEAREVFKDPNVIHLVDKAHSKTEERFYAVGRVKSGEIITVRYTQRQEVIRIFGAARWRKWRKYYEQNS